jgi:hypothetical protein
MANCISEFASLCKNWGARNGLMGARMKVSWAYTDHGVASLPASPWGPSERSFAIDALRGCALLGILLVNMGWYIEGPTTRVDLWAARVINP